MAALGERAYYIDSSAEYDAGHDIAEVLGISAQDREITAEQRLFRQVIDQAWRDAFAPDVRGPAIGVFPTQRKRGDHVANRASARNWLCSDIPEWRQDREEVCRMADVDEPKLTAAAREKLAEIKAEEQRQYDAEVQEAQKAERASTAEQSRFRARLLAGSIFDIRSTRRGPYRPQKPTERPAPSTAR